MYKQEYLKAVVAFLSENLPRLKQSRKETEQTLQHLKNGFFEEVTGNLAERNGYRARIYLDYLKEMLDPRDLYSYLSLTGLALDPDIEPLEARGVRMTMEELRKQGYLLEDIYDEGDGSQLREWKLRKMLENILLLYEWYIDIANFPESCHGVATQSIRIFSGPLLDPEKLKRNFEEIYLESISQPVSGDIPLEIKNTRFLLYLIPLTTTNLKIEIQRNFEKVISGVNRPYLLLLRDKICRKRDLAAAMAGPYCEFAPGTDPERICGKEGWAELRELLEKVHRLRLSSLEEICLQIDSHLEKQDLLLKFLERPNTLGSSVNKDYLVMKGPLDLDLTKWNIPTSQLEEVAALTGSKASELRIFFDHLGICLRWARLHEDDDWLTGKKWIKAPEGDYRSLWDATECAKVAI